MAPISASRLRGRDPYTSIMGSSCDNLGSVNAIKPPLVQQPSRIVVGIDGSEMSLIAVSHAALLAKAFQASVIAVHAVGMLSRINGEMYPSDQVQEELKVEMQNWTTLLRDNDVEYTTVLEDGPPGLVLTRVAERENAGLLVVGTRGLGSADDVVLGSTCYHLMRFSPVPLFIIPGTGAVCR